LGHVVGAFTSLTTVVYMRGVRDRRWPTFRRRLWQRGYHDRVIRDEEHLRRVRDYIANNPVRWRASP
jgi:REP element-mobilizing transposase RayT